MIDIIVNGLSSLDQEAPTAEKMITTYSRQIRNKRLNYRRFNELDNWIGLMEVDPPTTLADKKGMYLRLNEIMEQLFVSPASFPPSAHR